jgi:outer membrane protein TolC
MKTGTMSHMQSLAIAVAAVVLTTAGWAAAEDGQSGLTTYTPGERPGERVGLRDSILLTAEFNPNLFQAREQSLFNHGSLRQSTGLFDASLVFDLGINLQSNEIGDSSDRLDVTTASVDLGLQKLFRNGVSINPAIQVESIRNDFVGVGIDGVEDTTTSVISVRLDVPLGKGRGKVSTGSTERAAAYDLEASVEDQAHTLAQSALQTSLVYWGVLAAQERLALLEGSVDINNRIVEIGEALVAAGEMISGDLAQTRARLAEARAQHITARRLLLEAQLALSDAIGLRVEQAGDVPTVTDEWPDLPGQEELASIDDASLTELALSMRRDLAAARLRTESARVLEMAARADLTVRTDLSASLAYRGFDRDRSYLDGWVHALFGRYPGPSGSLSLSFDWPFKNNVARGQYAQTRSAHHQAAINETDLERVIGNNIERLTGSLLEATQEVRDRQTSTEHYTELVQSEIQRFELGESEVLNVIFTEQEQITQLLLLVSARQNLASLVSQLRFEAGVMVTHRVKDNIVVAENIQPTGYRFEP